MSNFASDVNDAPKFLNEKRVEELLTWPLIFEAVEQALMSVSVAPDNQTLPVSSQPARSFTVLPDNSGVLLSMPGYIGNYKLPSVSKNLQEKKNTLACKLVTSFNNNAKLAKPLPNIMGTIFLFDDVTGKLKAIVESTALTAWRTTGASLVATQHLYFNRIPVESRENKILSIIGCGTQV